MNYIGSKLSLLDEIRGMLRRQGIAGGSFCDLFSGTTVVAQMARAEGFSVVANDLQAYSFIMQQAFLLASGYPAFERLHAELPDLEEADATRARPSFGLGPEPGDESRPLRRVLAHLESLPGERGPFYEAYCEGGESGRCYFAAETGQRCEAIRGAIARWHADGLIDDVEHAVLLASLIESMDQLANTASVYGAYLKHLKKTARAPLTLRLPRLLSQPGAHRACREDGNALVARLAAEGPQDVLYLDPPYNHRQYHANYHVLETIARWDLDAFEPQGKTGLRPAENHRSRYCSRRQVQQAFGELLAAADFKHILVSYNNEGLIPEAELRAMLEAKAGPEGRCDFHTLPYKRFRADQDGASRRYKGDAVREFLFYVRVGA